MIVLTENASIPKLPRNYINCHLKLRLSRSELIHPHNPALSVLRLRLRTSNTDVIFPSGVDAVPGDQTLGSLSRIAVAAGGKARLHSRRGGSDDCSRSLIHISGCCDNPGEMRMADGLLLVCSVVVVDDWSLLASEETHVAVV